jgi:hypothetical protein
MPSISFQPSADDLIDANRAFIAVTLKSRRMARIYLIGAAIFGIGGAALLWSDRAIEPALGCLGAILYWTVLLAVGHGLNALLLPRRTRRTFAQQKDLHGPVSIDWSEQGVAIQSARGSARFAWEDFVRVVEGRRAILLFQSDRLYNFIPKRTLTPDQAVQIMAFARRAPAC